jgi:8-oxo-dGTP pyrophosphatase MutT (NUDIX family)
VGIVALEADDRVVLVGQHRYPLDIYSWEIPEGGVPAGEDPLDGAKRELLEETGVVAASWREIGRFHLSNSVTDEAGILYLATDLAQEAAAPEATEELSIRWVPFEKALAMTLDGRISDAMAIMGIQRLAIERAGHPGT